MISVWSQRLISYNVALLYFTTTWLKFDGILWRNGTATYYTAHLREFHRFPVPEFVNSAPVVMVSTYATLAVEFALGTLVFFKPLRKYVLITGVLLHFYIDYSMNIPLFSYLMISGYISFYEGEEIVGFAKRVGERLRQFQVSVFYPHRGHLTNPAAAFLRAVDPFGLVKYQRGDSNEWTASMLGNLTVPAKKVTKILSIGAYPFSWWPGLWNKILEDAVPVEATTSPSTASLTNGQLVNDDTARKPPARPRRK
jgi:hypothetical protein